MDYTTLAKMKEAMDSQETTQDPILADYITRASRLIDLLITGVPGASDYFSLATVTDQILSNGCIDYTGRITVYPHKYPVVSVSAMSYRYSLRDTWKTANVDHTAVEGEAVVYDGAVFPSDRVYVRISYSGGFSATPGGLPQDLLELATLMSVRLFKEARSGLGDAIGVAELGTMVYTKALPVRAVEIIRHYERIAPWT